MDTSADLRAARRRAGLSTRQLAGRAATSHSAIVAYESGAKAPLVTTMARLLAGCGFDPSIELRARDPFEDRTARGRELIEVLALADELPAEHGPEIAARFTGR